jgi:HAD superfamily hydrolase (TIGR01509 family)
MPTKLRAPQAVLFDVGDTLLVEKRFDLEAGIASIAGTHLKIPTLAQAFRAEVVESHLRYSEPLLAAWLRDRVPGLSVQSVESIEDTVWAAIVTLEPQPGALTVLRTLAGDGIVAGAVSNAAFSSRILQAELGRHGLAQYLQFVLTSADRRSRKPAAAIFDAAVARLGVAAADVWFVGDTLEEDIAGARAGGLQPIWLKPHAPEASPLDVPTVRDWREFMELYASVRAPAG